MARSDELAASVARERLDMQFKQVDGLDTKATALLGFTSVVLALLFNSNTVSENWGAPFVVAAAAFAVGVLALGYTIYPRGFKFNPSVSALRRWSKYSSATTAYLVTRSIEVAMPHNRRHLDRKLRGLQAGGACIIVGVIAVSVGLVTSSHANTNKTRTVLPTTQLKEPR
jgi:hypothetical protein